uniref:Retrotransposon protein, putative, Ty3-gypsy subclass n=1 Tax=Oryza sativa subsp. japonica TaxID=39947 RepID=Q2R4E1_ORYSJ|nr:retrotransposon protein, putative, Ty3-gypsy subclass [Oryza sativa Japonica Group]
MFDIPRVVDGSTVFTFESKKRRLARGPTGSGAQGPKYRWQLFYPLAGIGMQSVENSRFYPLKYHAIGTFNLSITHGMRYGGVTNLDAEVFTKVFKYSASKLSAVISDDPIGYPKPVHNVDKEISRLVYRDCNDRFSFNPLGKFVNSHKEVSITTNCLFKRADHVKPPGQDNGMVCTS